MQPNDELFCQIIREKGMGNRLPDDSLLRSNPLFAYHKSLTDGQIEQFRPFWDREGKFPHQTPILMDYLESTLAQASAFTHNNQHVISIHCGVIVLLEFMFNSLMCKPDFLGHVGDPRVERDDLPSIPLTTDYNSIFHGLRRHGLEASDFIPRDEKRRAIAGILTYSAIRFLICHEFRHIQAGHTVYYKRHFHLMDIAESISKCGSVDIAMKRQAMEWDADRFAMHRLLMHWLAPNAFRVNDEAFRQLMTDKRLVLFLCLTACSALFRLLDGLTPDPSEWNTLSHPPSRNRRLVLFTTALLWAEDRYPVTFNTTVTDEIMRDCVNQIEIVLSGIWGCRVDKDYSVLVGHLSCAHERETMTVWKAIMPELATYAYVPLEACPQ